ncbi:hypothetical protein CKY01_12100 [Photorhabdus laumondii subsp. clarkei]|uniref:Uncharacterized protein n=1 Tax=Photorhabdus laumondii subsp. clarkei TaxID=2029685 RepID=A0A329VFZ2_9GAMM|nr:hypothetical protein CKY01_12100 [Photorhabdus laumondii subsp. clarkei]
MIIKGIWRNDDKFLIKDIFFSSNIFYSYSECFVGNNIYMKGVIDVGCLFYKEDLDSEQEDIFNYGAIRYQITLSLYKGKSKVSFYSFDKIVNERNSMIDEVNFLMQFFSENVIDAINQYGFKTDLDHHLNMKRELLNHLYDKKINFDIS